MVLKRQEWYYIVSIYKYYQVTLFLVLIQKFDRKSNFQPDWPELGLIRFDQYPDREKFFLKRREWWYVVSMYKHFELTLYLIQIRKFDQKSNFQPRFGQNLALYKSRIGPKLGENVIFKSQEQYCIVIFSTTSINLVSGPNYEV